MIEPKPKWERAVSAAFKIYAGFCTLLLGAYLVLLAWSSFLRQKPPGNEETNLAAAYGRYMAHEYPKRGDAFLGLATSLGWRAKAVPVLRADVLKYIGKPDSLLGTLDTGELLYIYYPPGKTNQWGVYVSMRQGRLVDLGFSRADDRAEYHPYSREVVPNQGEAKASPPFSSDTNRTSTAAAPRRSPGG